MNTSETDGKSIEGRKRVKISPYEETEQLGSLAILEHHYKLILLGLWLKVHFTIGFY